MLKNDAGSNSGVIFSASKGPIFVSELTPDCADSTPPHTIGSNVFIRVQLQYKHNDGDGYFRRRRYL